MATLQTPTSAVAWRPDLTTFAAQDVVNDALILQCSTLAGAVDGDAPSVRVAYIDDDTAEFVAEAAPIPEAQPTLAEVTIHTGKISKLLRVSSEQFFQAGTSDQLAGSVSRALIRRADLAFLSEANPTAPAVAPAGGILNHADILGGGAVTSSLDPLVDLIAEIQHNGGQASHIVVSPKGWASLRKLKVGTDRNDSLLGAGVTDAQELLLSLPVLVNVAVPEGTGIVLDQRAVVSAVGPVQVATSTEAYFDSDSVALRATWRIGQNLVRPNRVGKFTIGAATRAK